MNKFLILPVILFSMMMHSQNKSIHDFSITTIEGRELELSSFKGKKILMVNTASKCGFTPQYKDLEELSRKYKDRLVVIGFPANNFMNQEPGTNEEIAEFCELNYGVSFPMSEKISVKGKDMHPIYQWLTKKELNGKESHEIQWNFNKFLIDENGNWLAYFGSSVKPMDDEILKYLN